MGRRGWAVGPNLRRVTGFILDRGAGPGYVPRMRWLLLLAALVPSTLAAAETPPDPTTLPAPEKARVPRLAAAVTIDGRLDEPVWAQAARLGPFRRNDTGGAEREPTFVRIWYDDTALHLGWSCDDADVSATLTARDANLWEEEVVEFFVSPEQPARYFEFQWNPVGGVFDARVTNELDGRGLSRRIDVDRSFTAAGMTNAVRISRAPAKTGGQGGWKVEVKLPFASLGRTAPRAGEIWRANFYRYNRTRGEREELVSWSPTRLRSFHQPVRFGRLEFGP